MPVTDAALIDVPAPHVQEHAIEAALVPVAPFREAATGIVLEAPREAVPVRVEPEHLLAEVDISPAAPPLPSFELPPELIQVETAPGKAGQTLEAEPTAGLTQLGERPRRPRPPEEPIPSEPLVQIETRH